MVAYLLRGDPSLRAEHLVLLVKMAPTVSEARALRAADREKLLAPERLLLALTAVGRLRAKLEVAIFIREWREDATMVREAARVVQEVASRVRESVVLKDVLRLVLQIGNVLNDGTRQGNAEAVRLASLLKLADVKITAPISDAAEKGSSTRTPTTTTTTTTTTRDEEDGAEVVDTRWRKAAWSRARNLLEFVAVALLLESPWRPGKVEALPLLGPALGPVGKAIRATSGELDEGPARLRVGMQVTRSRNRGCHTGSRCTLASGVEEMEPP